MYVVLVLFSLNSVIIVYYREGYMIEKFGIIEEYCAWRVDGAVKLALIGY